MNDALQSEATEGEGGDPAAEAHKVEGQDAPAEQGEPEQPVPDPEIEARAKATGWRGPTKQFPTADAWNEHAENNLPLIQSANRKLEAELTKLRQADDERERRVEERIDRAVKIVLAGFDRQQRNDRADYEARWDNHIDAASKRGEDIRPLLAQKRENMAAWDAKAAKEREEREKDSRVEEKAKAQPQNGGVSEEDAALFEKWVGENDWWNTDDDLTALAQGYANQPRVKALPSTQEQLAEIAKLVRASPLYAAKNGRSAPPRASAVGTTPPRGPNGQFMPDTVGKLSAEDKRDFDYIWKSLNGAPYHGETDKDKALRKFADRLAAKA